MLDLGLLIVFLVMSFRVFMALGRESEILREFKQPPALRFVVLLFPFGALCLIVGRMLHLPLPLNFTAAFACYIPALVLARRVDLALQRAGTDRVKEAQTAVNQAFGTALAGIVYVAIAAVLALIKWGA